MSIEKISLSNIAVIKSIIASNKGKSNEDLSKVISKEMDISINPFEVEEINEVDSSIIDQVLMTNHLNIY